MKSPIKIGIFKPTNIRNNNAFATGQYTVFEKLQRMNKIEIHLITDDKLYTSKNFRVKFLEIDLFKTFFNRIIKKLSNKPYLKIPYYKNLILNDFDVVITEGIHYPILKYLFRSNSRIIFNDSITLKKLFNKEKVTIFNENFKNSEVVTVNPKIIELYNEFKVKAKTTFIGHAVSDKLKFLPIKKYNGKMISIGRLSEEKGFEIILKSCKLLKSFGLNFILDIYGEGPEKFKLQKIIKDFDLLDNVKLKGNFSHDELLKKLNNYSIFISHPLEKNNVAEAFNLSLAESMFAGLPSITSDCAGMKSI